MDRAHQPKQDLELYRTRAAPALGTYVQTRVIGSFPNSLLGEMVV